MSFYKVVLFVMCFSLWVHAGSEMVVNVFQNSAGKCCSKAYEDRKRLLEDSYFFKAAAQMGDMTHAMRRSLKTMRRWYRTHPTEVKLGSCLASYFNIKIPGLRRSEHLEDFKGLSIFPSLEDAISIKHRLMLLEHENHPNERAIKDMGDTGKSTIIESALSRFNASSLRDYYQNITDNFSYYHHLITTNQLAICVWNYLVRKFWIWVDSAPTD